MGRFFYYFNPRFFRIYGASPRTYPTTSARLSSPSSPTPIASRRPCDLRRHDLTVDGSHEEHKAQGSEHFADTHNGHHQVQHKCYH